MPVIEDIGKRALVSTGLRLRLSAASVVSRFASSLHLALAICIASIIMPSATVHAETPSATQAAPSDASSGDVSGKLAPAPDKSLPEKPAPDPLSPPSSQVEATEGATSADASSLRLPHDLSPVGMFMHADIVVKGVMVGLGFASLMTWTIFLAKSLELLGESATARQALSTITCAATLRDAGLALKNPKAPATRLVNAALVEIDRSSGLAPEGVKERAAALLARIEAQTGRFMARGTGILATIGSTAPFVGLFGTVWGIMNSFIGISKTNTTNLAVVAPGIAEALLATACGLVAAIPAVVIYNLFARAITAYRSLLGDTSTEVLRLLSRDLDSGGLKEGNQVILPERAAE